MPPPNKTGKRKLVPVFESTHGRIKILSAVNKKTIAQYLEGLVPEIVNHYRKVESNEKPNVPDH